MTTPQTPSNALDVSDVSDEINPASYTQGQQDIGANNIVRQLTGSEAKTRTNSEILFSDLSNKVAFSEILATSTSNTQGGVGSENNPITAQLTLQANSDMYSPTIDWTYSIDGGSENVIASDITITKPTSKQAIVKLSSISGTKVANLTVTGVMSVSGHVVNTCTKNIKLTVDAVNTAFEVTAVPGFTVNATGVSAQTATITLNAQANAQLAGVTFAFTPTFVSGTGPLSPIIGPSSVVFTATAPTASTNAAVYSVKTDMYYQGALIRSNTATVDLKAQFIDRQITSLTPAALSNNQFANSTSQYSTIDVTAVHNSVAPTYPQGVITFTLESSGDAVTQQTISSNSSTVVERISLYHDVAADGFGFKSAKVVVVATLRSPDGVIMDQKRSQAILLKAGTYGLTIVPPASNTQSGYSAQTATATATATVRAGFFMWESRQFNGSGPILTTDGNNLNIIATTPTGKNATQTISNTCNFDITGKLIFAGVTVATQTFNDILIKAESLPYTYSLSVPSTSNVQMEINAVAHARMVVSASKSTGTITWTRDNTNVGLDPSATSVLMEVDSPADGGANVQSVVVTGTLRDGTSRLIEALSTSQITLDAATSKLQITGDDVTVSSDQKTATAVGIYESTAVVGTHSLRFPPVKKGGSDLQLTQENSQKISITATATQSSKSGSYEITGVVDYKGIIRTVVKEVTVSVDALAPSLTYTKYPYEYDATGSVGSFSGIGLPGTGGGNFAILYKGEDIVVETDYPGTINTDFTIRRTIARIGKFGEVETVAVTGPFYGQAANTNAAPQGFPATTGGKKRRDRVETIPFINFGLLDYKFIYELVDPNGVVLISNTVTSLIDVPPPQNGQTKVTLDTTTGRTYTVTDKPVNGFGYPEPYPQTVVRSQRADFTASYASEITLSTPRFVFTTEKENSSAVVSVVTNDINGQVNVTAQSVYYDSPANEFVTTQSSGKVTLNAQLTSDNINIGSVASGSYTFDLKFPIGRCYRLATYSYGVRGYHTRDVFGNSSEQIDYGRVPGPSSLSGPETKYVGFHDGARIYDINNGRPLYATDTAKTRYYSSEAHRTNHQNMFPKETSYPSKIIPANYFMVMSFNGAGGEPYIGEIRLLGSDNNTYKLGTPWAIGFQNDTSRDNDAFHWYIFQWAPPAGVTFSYAFISNAAGVDPPDITEPGSLSFTAVQPGNVLVGQQLNLQIGTVSGGVIAEDLYVDPGTIAGGGATGGDTGGGIKQSEFVARSED